MAMLVSRTVRRGLAAAAALLVAACLLPLAAQAAPAPGWKILGATGPTNLPPFTSEIQKLAVNAEGGTYTLEFGGQTSAPIAFDASAAQLAAALEAVPTVGSGNIQVSGGPGNASAAFPYFVRFVGERADQNLSPLVADSTPLSGASHTATVSTKQNGGSPGQGEIVVYATNVGGKPSSGAIPTTVKVGPLPSALTMTPVTARGWTCAAVSGENSVKCSSTAPVAAGFSASAIALPVSIAAGAPTTAMIPLRVEGGGAAGAPTETQLAVAIIDSPSAAGLQSFWAGAFDETGQAAVQAGGHPFAAASGFLLNTNVAPNGALITAGDVRTVTVELPPGFAGNPLVTPRCPQGGITNNRSLLCPAAAQVGILHPLLAGLYNPAAIGSPEDIFNVEPPTGYPAEFGVRVATASVGIVASVRSESDYGVTVMSPDLPQNVPVYGSFLTLFGDPPGAAGKPFLTNPTDCAEQASTVPTTTMAVNSWEDESPTAIDNSITVTLPPVAGCDALEFEPDFSFQPSSRNAASVTAAIAHLHLDQSRLLEAGKLAPPHLKRSVVTLPQGLVLDPAAAADLEACSTRQIGLITTEGAPPNRIRFNNDHVSCPDASKIGTAKISTPLLEEPLSGIVYLATQEDNPFHSLLAMYLVIDDAKTGIVAKLPGEVQPDPQTGQLKAVFDDNPQLPFEDLTLNIRGGGPHSTLATPDVCGTYTTTGEWTPWSAPESGPPAQTEDTFEVTSGVGGSACPTSKAARPFDLGLSAGTTNVNAGHHSPFTLDLTRPDGNKELDKVSVTMPPGLAATFKGVTTCSAAAIAAAQAPGRTGRQEIANPSCPASSQIGTITVSAGVGSQPLVVKTGKAYLTGPYKGAPLSFTFIVPAVAGPFDLGVQVVKTAINVNPKTAQVTAVSDSIPQILKGIPLLIREVRVDVDRDNFTLNPTNCELMAVNADVTGASGAVAKLSNRFQVGNCGALKFHPNLKLQLHGRTTRGKYQRLTATVSYPQGNYANIARAAVTLPHSEFLAQEHIRTVCTRVQFAAHACPGGSIYGHATAITPLLDEPLSGPVYLRSSDNPLPDLVAALRGPDSMPIEVELSGRTDSKNGGIRNTFDLVPDAPVSKFTLQLFGGKKSLIVNSRNLCKGKEQRATARFTAQNGLQRNFRPLVKNDCAKASGRKGKKGGRRHAV